MTSPRPGDAWLALRHCREAYNALEARNARIEAAARWLAQDLIERGVGDPVLIAELRDALLAREVEPWT